ncbi:MAG TPA: cysteine--tRNA ligase [Chloroflexota bacterium]|nr:cysteine--tRNA ligase [Chloroflexota bacterium]
MTEQFPIYLHNTLGRRVEEFQPQNPDEVLVYTCGPTVYSYQHIGNFRAFLFADTLRRVLEYNGYRVRHVRNITDVGHLTNETLGTGVDKMEAAARRENLTPREIADHFTEIFHRDQALLNILEPTAEPRATEYIPQMISLTERLIGRGYGYCVKGDVYYDVDKFPSYGMLSGNTVEDLIAGARVEVGEGKRSPADFALWKAAAPDKLMRYESPWGMGVPGWHLECSAMALDLLGETLDIHTGGEDHVFPHHEDEIAQSEGATGKRFARYWLHNAFLQLSGAEKMSKSVGNILTVGDLAERGIHPLSYRYFTYQAHYRTPQNFTWEALEAAQTALYRIYDQVADLLQSSEPAGLTESGAAVRNAFREAINNDLALPEAVAVLNTMLSNSTLPPEDKLSLLDDFDRVLALDLLAVGRGLIVAGPAEREILDRRAQARAERDWALSDELRSKLAAGGLDVKDTAQGQRWTRSDVLPRVQAPQTGAGH